jgi:hypothetical protein
MPSLKLGKLLRILAVMLVSAALASAICAQNPPHLQVAVGTNQQISIIASHVSYGEVLRALRAKLGWEIEIPALADDLKLSYVRLETSRPQEVLAKLLEGSGLGYAFLGEVKGSRSLRVLVIPLAPRETKTTQDTVSASTLPISDNAAAEVSLPVPAQAQTVTTVPPNANPADLAPEKPQPASTMPLSEAINAIGAPPGVSLNDVGKSMTLPLSDAASIMGVPSGASPGDVGKTITLPLPTGPGRRP